MSKPDQIKAARRIFGAICGEAGRVGQAGRKPPVRAAAALGLGPLPLDIVAQFGRFAPGIAQAVHRGAQFGLGLDQLVGDL